ncbi:MAG: 23S rRNA (adenine(2503)-C(2))-methyltransferase RlmN [Planctomycetota bacterium]
MAAAPHNPPLSVFGATPDELADRLAAVGMPRYRAKQVLAWVYRRGVIDPEAMTDLSADDRKRLADHVAFVSGTLVADRLASDGTRKLLIDWSVAASSSSSVALPLADGATGGPSGGDDRTECVMIPTESRRTACISSQVGCPVGCRFCASGLGGLDRNLTAGQIVEQAWRLAWMRDAHGEPVGLTNLVFMGMGEPLANFGAVTRAVEVLTAKWAMDLAARRMTLSTVGLPAQMRRLAEADLPPITLAISLHAPNDELRREIIPWADYVAIDQLVDAGRHYFDRTGREVTLEYILLGGVNDRPGEARQLADVAKRLRSNVNLIRYNEVAGLPYARPDGDAVHRFQRILRDRGVNVHVRASRGRDIAAACGQLRHEHRAGSTKPAGVTN